VGGSGCGVVEGGVPPAVLHAEHAGAGQLLGEERVDVDAQVRVVTVSADAAELDDGGLVTELDHDGRPLLDGVADLDDGVGAVRAAVASHEGFERLLAHGADSLVWCLVSGLVVRAGTTGPRR
jgi:hypothetical protein